MELVQRVRRAGISVTLYAMIGFPGETREEARLTLDTILANREHIQEVSVRVFYLDETSEIFKRREEFGIVEVHADPDADLQVYYDFTPSEGMTRREARSAYLEFTRELRSHFPVFQNTNMLYHELKGHYFLYLCRHETWEALRDNVLERDASRTQLAGGKPRAHEGLMARELAFDRARIDERLSSIDSHTLRPRYQSDLIDDEDRARFDRELEPEQRGESVLVYDPRSGDVRSLSPAAELLLRRCDGSRQVEQVIEIVPATVRDDARRCVDELTGLGLVEEVTT